MKSVEMECALASWFNYRVNLIVPNVHWGMNIHECDLLVVSKAGYVTEVEIKRTVADLRAEAKKRHNHDMGNAKRLIKYLYFALSSQMLKKDMEQHQMIRDLVPAHAGILIVHTKEEVGHRQKVRRWREALPNKMATKISEKERYQIARLGAMRIWNLKRRK